MNKKNTPTITHIIKKTLRTAASLKITVTCLLILTVLVIAGTLYQAGHGLYQAQQKFFYSWVSWIGGIVPFPGTVLVLFILFFNLLAALFVRIRFRLSNIGNTITHLGILILLLGGFFTFYFSEESTLILKEGESSNTSESNRFWEIAVWEAPNGKTQSDLTDVYAIDAETLYIGRLIRLDELGTRLTFHAYYPNCIEYTNDSGIRQLKSEPLADDLSENTAGAILEITTDENAPNPLTLLLYGGNTEPTLLSPGGKHLFFSLRRKKIQLPIQLKLTDFTVVYYPNSAIPKSFESKVAIQTQGEGNKALDRDVVISMNKPLRFKDYTFFQSSYKPGPEGSQYTILAVVKNVGRLLPYFASVIIFLGLLIHFILMWIKRNKYSTPITGTAIMIAVCLLFALWPEPLPGQVEKPGSLAKMAIMENGRIKPIDTFAQNILKQFSGQSRFEKKPAIHWLARVLFMPEKSFDDKVFLVTNPEVLDSIDVPRIGKARDRYSFSQLRNGIGKLRQLAIDASKIDDKKRSFIENEILTLYNKVYFYQELTACFDFLFYYRDFSINQPGTYSLLDIPAHRKHFDFLDLALKKNKVQAILTALKEKEPGEWTPAEKEISNLYQRMEQWARAYQNSPLTVIPSVTRDGKEQIEKWISPWDIAGDIVLHPKGTISPSLFSIRDLVFAYRDGDQETFDRSVEQFNLWALEKKPGRIRPKVIAAEVTYNKIDPFYKAQFFYGFSVLFLLASFIIQRKWFYRFSLVLLMSGFMLHLAGQVTRMVIMSRPPVTNLYETFVFTALIAVLLGFILEISRGKNIGILTGGLVGLVLLLIAGKYALEGDTMGMLAAVLDSNFWLASHVVTIILGYAGILLSGFIGHVYIIQRIFQPHKSRLLENTFQAVYAIQAFGIIFTFLGTMLGGIWADQSWGRFWGWDPKENGALLILLWSAVLFHARLAGWIKETGFSLGTIGGIITVSLAWFGVNLLGVGLHSYGFTSGVANSLFIFVIIEFLFISISLLMLFVFKIKKTLT